MLGCISGASFLSTASHAGTLGSSSSLHSYLAFGSRLHILKIRNHSSVHLLIHSQRQRKTQDQKNAIINAQKRYDSPAFPLQHNLTGSKLCHMRLRSMYIIQHCTCFYPRIVRDQEDVCISRERFEHDGTCVELGLKPLVSFVITSVHHRWLAGRKDKNDNTL